MNTEVQRLIEEAQSLLTRLKEDPKEYPMERSPALADDVLVFCYRLRDGYRIVRTSSRQFHGPTFAFLNGLLYELESKPDETMKSSEWRSVLENVLSALASGAIVLQKDPGLSKR